MIIILSQPHPSLPFWSGHWIQYLAAKLPPRQFWFASTYRCLGRIRIARGLKLDLRAISACLVLAYWERKRDHHAFLCRERHPRNWCLQKLDSRSHQVHQSAPNKTKVRLYSHNDITLLTTRNFSERSLKRLAQVSFAANIYLDSGIRSPLFCLVTET